MLLTTHRVLLASLIILLALPAVAAAQDDRPPRIKNMSKIERQLSREYPLEMRRAGVVGDVMIELLVGTNGKPREIRIARGSGTLVLDAAALKIAREIRFDAARQDGEKVEQLVKFPLSFQTACGRSRTMIFEPDRIAAATGLNTSLIDIYAEKPTSTALLEVAIDTVGTPTSARIVDSTGLPDADTLVTRLAMSSRYIPVRWDGQAVPSRFRTVVAPNLVPLTLFSDDHAACGNGTEPRLLNGSALARKLQPMARSLSDAGSQVTQNATGQLFVGTDGRVQKVHIAVSSCWADLDRRISDVLETARYEAATCDNGEPLGVWVYQPVELHPR